MKCRVVRRYIGDYLDGALTATRRDAVREHISCCPHCRALLDEARRIRDVLHGSALDITPPAGLADRIKLRAAQVQEEAQIRARPSSAAIGSPAFVATCASVFMGAVMFYVVVTQFYPGGLGSAGALGTADVVAQAPETDSLPAPGPATTDQMAASRVLAMVSEHAAAASGSPGLPNAGTPAVAVPPVAYSAPAGVSRGRPRPTAAQPLAPSSPARTPARPAALAAIAPAAPVRIASAAVAKAVEAARPLVEGPVDHVASPGGARGRSGGHDASADEASRGVVAGLVAGYVVERYVVDRIIQAEPTLLAVTTSTPSSSGTALTERTKQ